MLKNESDSIGWREANTRTFWQELIEDIEHAKTHKGTALDTVFYWMALLAGSWLLYEFFAMLGRR
jgi:hypothetical protein